MTSYWGQGVRGAASIHITKITESKNIDKGHSTDEIRIVYGLLLIVDINQIRSTDSAIGNHQN